MKDIDVFRTFDMLSKLFPSTGKGLSALEPDLIGEHHVAEVTEEKLIEVCLSWAGDDGSTRQRILAVLNRATRQEHGKELSFKMKELLEKLLQKFVQSDSEEVQRDFVLSAIATPGELIDVIKKVTLRFPGFKEKVKAFASDELDLLDRSGIDKSDPRYRRFRSGIGQTWDRFPRRAAES